MLSQDPEPNAPRSRRLAASFAKAHEENRVALITYVTPGHPTREATDLIFDSMVEGGADIIEVGIPFSDPLADGATIQRVAFKALENGTTVDICLEFVERARKRHPAVPIVFMGYLNPLLAYGIERFAADAARAGADAMILVDLPPEEAGPIHDTFSVAGLDLIFLVAPTSSDERLEMIAEVASGFIYCVAVAGVTGARDQLAEGLDGFLARVRRCTEVPLAVGFGISRREHVQSLLGKVDAVVVASALMNVIDNNQPEDQAGKVADYVEMLVGRRPAGV